MPTPTGPVPQYKTRANKGRMVGLEARSTETQRHISRGGRRRASAARSEHRTSVPLTTRLQEHTQREYRRARWQQWFLSRRPFQPCGQPKYEAVITNNYKKSVAARSHTVGLRNPSRHPCRRMLPLACALAFHFTFEPPTLSMKTAIRRHVVYPASKIGTAHPNKLPGTPQHKQPAPSGPPLGNRG